MAKTARDFDVAVMGGGPAGCVTAIGPERKTSADG